MVWSDTQVGWILEILPLVAVHEQSVDHVADIDKKLGAPHALKEVARALHFGHEFGKDVGTTIRINSLHQAINGATKVGWIR